MGTYFASLFADLFYIPVKETIYYLFLSNIEMTLFQPITTPRFVYIDNRNNFPSLVNKTYTYELHPYKANASEKQEHENDRNLSIENSFEAAYTYDKRNNFDFNIVHFPFLYGDV